jgi:hypothetical protein
MAAGISEWKNFAVISIGNAEGTNTANIDSGAAITIPLLAGGVQPKFIYVAIGGGPATNKCVIAPGDTVVFANEGYVLQSATNCSVILNVHGYTELRYHETGDGTSTLYIYPLSDF